MSEWPVNDGKMMVHSNLKLRASKMSLGVDRGYLY